MIRSGWLVPILVTAGVTLFSTCAVAQSLPSDAEESPSAEPIAPFDAEEPAPPVLTLDAGGLVSLPRAPAAPPLLLAYHAAPPAAAMDPFAIEMALSGTNVPVAASSPTITFATTTAAAMQAPPTGDPYWGLENQRWGGAGGVSYYDLIDADFRLGAEREDWDRAERFEFSMYSREPLHGHVEAMIGGFIFWEERDWSEGAAKVLYDTWGFGVDMGAMIYPMKNADERKFNLGFLPYFRLAMGFGDGDFRNIDVDLPLGTGTASGDFDDLRFDLGVGVEARAVIARTFFAGVGVGYNWWTTAEGAAGTTSSGGVVIIVDDQFDFHGDEAYIRFSAGFFF